MIVLLDTSQDLDKCAKEMDCDVQQLLTPLTRYHLQRQDSPFAIDNGAFSKFEERAFMALLAREWDRRNQCLFVCAPDVVGSARRTLEVFEHWKTRLIGWKVALVAQDGQENLPIPWNEIDAIFIGGSTEFKLSSHSEQICRAAKALGKWVHIGRVNTPQRFEWAEGLADSIDGTGLSRYSWMRENIVKAKCQSRMFE